MTTVLRKILQAVAVSSALLALTGCGISASGLLPPEVPTAVSPIAKSVKIMPVEGGRASKFGREAYITNEQFLEALTYTVKESSVFSEVVESGDADLNLHSEVITITTEGGLSPTYAIVMQYWLVDPASGDEVWRRGINTRHQVKFSEHLAGATRIIKAVQGATHKNLLRLTESLEAAEL